MTRPIGPHGGRGDRPFQRAKNELNSRLKGLKVEKRFDLNECSDVYRYYFGRCAFCSRPLHVREFDAKHGVHFVFYIPIEAGGAATLENLVATCRECASEYRGTRELRQSIPDLNAFPDVLQALVVAVKDDLDEPTSTKREKIKLIKRYLNMQLEDMVRSFRYKPFSDWKSEATIFFKEGETTIADFLESLTVGVLSSDEKQEETAKEEIKESIKQVMGTKTYKILRNNTVVRPHSENTNEEI